MMSFTRPLMQGVFVLAQQGGDTSGYIEVFACSLHSFIFFFRDSKARVTVTGYSSVPYYQVTDSHSVNSVQKSSS